MIKGISHNSRNTEVDAFASRIVDVYESSGINTDSWLKEMFTTIKQM